MPSAGSKKPDISIESGGVSGLVLTFASRLGGQSGECLNLGTRIRVAADRIAQAAHRSDAIIIA